MGGAAAAAGVALVLAAPAFACTPLSTITSRPAHAATGTVVAVNGSGFVANGSGIDIKWGGPNGRLLTSTSPDGSGIFAAQVTIPSDARVAYYQLSAVQAKEEGGTVAASFAFLVDATPASASTSAQPPAAVEPAPVADQPQPQAATQVPVVTPPSSQTTPAAAPAAARPAAQRSAAPVPGPVAAPAATSIAVPSRAAGATQAAPEVVTAPDAQASPLAPVAVLDEAPTAGLSAPGGSSTVRTAPLAGDVGASRSAGASTLLLPLLLMTLLVVSAGSAAVHHLRRKRVRVVA